MEKGTLLKRKIKKYFTSVYFGLAVCIVAVVAVSIATLNYNYGNLDENLNLSIPDYSFPDTVSKPETSTPRRSDTSEPKSEAPVNNDTSGIDDKVIEQKNYYRPVSGKISKAFNKDKLVFSETMNDYRTHKGVDIAAEKGSAVLSYADGTITEIKKDPLMGYTVTVSHGFGLTSHYFNLSEAIPLGISVGTAVKAGDVIGAVGESALIEISDPPHLHFELRVDGVNIDPEKEIPTT